VFTPSFFLLVSAVFVVAIYALLFIVLRVLLNRILKRHTFLL
jgi:hypothetical protein